MTVVVVNWIEGVTASSIACIATLETKHDILDGKFQQVLINQSETKEAIEEVKSMLTKCMTKFGDIEIITLNLPTSIVDMHSNMNFDLPEVVRH